jgi:glycosyltransferase involved in cell wall biosynthesis/SAM-dependent methyltransferase
MAFAHQEQRTHNLSKVIIDHYGYVFFRGKTVLDLGCGLGQIGNALARLGATVTAVDARDKNLKSVQTNFPHIRTIKLDLDKEFPFGLFEFDIVLSLGALCHIKHYEQHLQNLCNVAEHIILETEVLDTRDQDGRIVLYEEKAIDDLSFGGESSIVSSTNIQHKLSHFGATFKLINETKLNYGGYRYDWMEQGAGRKHGNRRMWFAHRNKFLALQERHRQEAADLHREMKPLTPILHEPEIAPQVSQAPDSVSTVNATLDLTNVRRIADGIRVLYLSFGYQSGIEDGFRNVGANLDVFDFWSLWERTKDHGQVRDEFLAHVRNHKPNLIHMDLQFTGLLDNATLVEARKLSPSVIITNWTGDVRGDVAPEFTQITDAIDYSLISSTGQLSMYRNAGYKNVKHWQIGYDPKCSFPTNNTTFDFDISFVGNYHGDTAPDDRTRHLATAECRKVFGDRFGLFGTGFGTDVNTVDPSQTNAIYNRSICTLNISRYNNIPHYFSDRLLRCVASGRPTITWHFPGIEDYFIENKEILVARSIQDIIDKVHFCKNNPDSANEIGKNGYKRLLAEHTFTSRILELIKITGLVSTSQSNTQIINSITSTYNTHDKKFVIVIPSYKNERWCEKNIKSALDQNYTNFRVIFTDDCSPDATFGKTNAFVMTHHNGTKATLIKNTNRVGALENLYNMIHSCDDDEIILTLDGDDWFPDNDVLNKLNRTYSGGDIWMTYGQYKNSTDGGRGVAQQYPDHVINNNNFRRHIWSASHLRTFYAWLFKRIRREDLMKDGKFFVMTWDFAMMFPMLEMAGEHSKYISDILYVYNLDNPINDHKVNIRLQHNLDSYIRNMARYPRTTKPVFPPPKTKIGLLLIATGKYHKFIQGMISSADKFFFNDQYNVSYYIFSDETHNIQSSRRIENIHIDHKSFPYASMDRFKHFTNNADKLSREDYLYYVDVDCLFVDNVKEEILGDLVGVRHCGFYKGGGPYEKRESSTSFVHPSKYKYYYGGGFSGGRTGNYLALAKWCSGMLDADTNNNIVPVWHDESILNKYFSEHIPSVILSPSYHYPQGHIARYQKIWSPDNFKAKILLLDKNHAEVRK